MPVSESFERSAFEAVYAVLDEAAPASPSLEQIKQARPVDLGAGGVVLERLELVRARRRLAAVLAGVVVVVLLALLIAVVLRFVDGSSPVMVEPGTGPSTPTTGQPPTTVSPDGTRPTNPELAEAYDVVLEAFTAIYDADWRRFLSHLHPDGVFRDAKTHTEYPWSTFAIDEVLRPDVDLDYDEDGVISRAEQFLVAAQYLALAPIEIAGCESVPDGTPSASSATLQHFTAPLASTQIQSS